MAIPAPGHESMVATGTRNKQKKSAYGKVAVRIVKTKLPNEYEEYLDIMENKLLENAKGVCKY